MTHGNLKKLISRMVEWWKCVDKIIKKLIVSSSIPEETRRSLKPVGTRSVIMYEYFKFTKISLIITCLCDLFYQQLIFLPVYAFKMVTHITKYFLLIYLMLAFE